MLFIVKDSLAQPRCLITQTYYENGQNLKNAFGNFTLVLADMDVQQQFNKNSNFDKTGSVEVR